MNRGQRNALAVVALGAAAAWWWQRRRGPAPSAGVRPDLSPGALSPGLPDLSREAGFRVPGLTTRADFDRLFRERRGY